MILLQKPMPHSSILSDMILRCIRKSEVGNQIVAFPIMWLRLPTLAYGEAGHPVFAIFPAVSLMLLVLT